jgi:hypothetical protein
MIARRDGSIGGGRRSIGGDGSVDGRSVGVVRFNHLPEGWLGQADVDRRSVGIVMRVNRPPEGWLGPVAVDWRSDGGACESTIAPDR